MRQLTDLGIIKWLDKHGRETTRWKAGTFKYPGEKQAHLAKMEKWRRGKNR
jgi:hypothetical protein